MTWLLRFEHRPSAVLAGIVAALLLVACSRGAGTGASPSASGGGGPTLSIATTGIGQVVTGPDGKTLYMFAKDTAEKSACNDECATNWPPLTVPSGQQAVAGQGMTAEWLHTITRDDGTIQVSYGGHPLYYFAGDKAAGDTNGQDVKDVWYAAGADGQPLQAEDEESESSSESPSASASASSSSSDDGGYSSRD